MSKKPSFSFFIQCLDHKKLMPVSYDDLEISIGHQETEELALSRIMIVTDNVLEKLAMQISLKQLGVAEHLQCVNKISDAVKELST